MGKYDFLDDSMSEEYMSYTWDIDRTIKKLRAIPSTQDKIKFLQRELITWEKTILEVKVPSIKRFKKAVPHYKRYVNWCELEIKNLELDLPEKAGKPVDPKTEPLPEAKRPSSKAYSEPDNALNTFEDIFVSDDWHKYINALCMVDPPVLELKNGKFKFLGSSARHKGVIASWIHDLQHKGIIKLAINRKSLARVLNNEIEDLDMGKDGRTIENHSATYQKDYRAALLEKTK